jgi:hypothetical protein
MLTWITIGQKGTNGKEYFGDSQDGTPIILENIKTNLTLTIHVTMINSSTEEHFRRFEWIVLGEMNVQEKDAT